MTTRLSIISLAGMARTLVAVGTSNDAFMFFTTAAAAPRSTVDSSPSLVGAADLASALVSALTGLASASLPLGSAALVAALGSGALVSVVADAVLGSGFASADVAGGGAGAGVGGALTRPLLPESALAGSVE